MEKTSKIKNKIFILKKCNNFVRLQIFCAKFLNWKSLKNMEEISLAVVFVHLSNLLS